jgi:hypothetical protein
MDNNTGLQPGDLMRRDFGTFGQPRETSDGRVERQEYGAAGTRYFIRMGNPGFNSEANNGSGYSSVRAAVRAITRYEKKG